MRDVSELERQLAEKDKEIAALRQQLQDEVGTLKRLIELTTMLNSTLNLGDLLRLIMTDAAELLRAETSLLALVDEETGEMIFEVATGTAAQEIVKHRNPPGRGITGWVVQNAQPALVDNPAEDPRFYREIDRATGLETRNILVVPLRVKDKVIGATAVINKLDAPSFSQKDLELAEALASQAAVAIDNARLYAGLTDALVTSRLSYRL